MSSKNSNRDLPTSNNTISRIKSWEIKTFNTNSQTRTSIFQTKSSNNFINSISSSLISTIQTCTRLLWRSQESTRTLTRRDSWYCLRTQLRCHRGPSRARDTTPTINRRKRKLTLKQRRYQIRNMKATMSTKRWKQCLGIKTPSICRRWSRPYRCHDNR